MNRTYRTLWSETTQTYVAVAENVKSHGKKSGSLKTVSAAVAAALLTLGAGQVMASSCPVGPHALTTINVADTDQCVLSDGNSISISGSGSITTTSTNNHAVKVNSSSTAGSITNSGVIDGGEGGIYLETANTLGISNAGTITGQTYHGIYLINGGINGGISNAGTITGRTDGIDLYDGINLYQGRIIGDITNSGTISGANAGIAILSLSTVTGNIVNSGTISGGVNDSIYVNSYSTVGIIQIQGNNSAKFIGLVDAPNTPVTVASGATYTMDNGQQFTVSNFTNAGTLKIGATTTTGSIGTITGNFTNTGTFSPVVADMTHYGKLVVSGTANLGGTLMADAASVVQGALTEGGTLAGVITAGTLSGTFNAASSYDNSNFYDLTPVYTGTDFSLTIAATSQTAVLAATTATGNNPARGAARVFDSIITGDTPIVTVSGGIQMPEVITLLDGLAGQGDKPLSDAVSQTLPLLTGGMNQSVSNALHGTSRIIQSRQEGQHGRSTGDEFFGDQHAWFKPFGSWANQNDRNGVSGFNAHSYGMVFGADAEVTDNDRVGIAFSYAHSNIDGNSSVAPQSANVSSYQLVGYGSHNLSEDTDINFQADIGQHNNTCQRNITFASTIAKSDYTSWTGHVGVGLAHNYTLSEKTTLTPSIRADYAIIRGESYTETGAGALNLNVNANTTHELILGVDSKLAHALTDKTTLTANIGVGYDTINKQASITSAFAGAPSTSFVTYGLDPSPWIMRGGLGMVGKMTETVEISARYDIEARKDFDNQTASVKVRWAF